MDDRSTLTLEIYCKRCGESSFLDCYFILEQLNPHMTIEQADEALKTIKCNYCGDKEIPNA
jgi:ribosomal protein L37E